MRGTIAHNWNTITTTGLCPDFDATDQRNLEFRKENNPSDNRVKVHKTVQQNKLLDKVYLKKQKYWVRVHQTQHSLGARRFSFPFHAHRGQFTNSARTDSPDLVHSPPRRSEWTNIKGTRCLESDELVYKKAFVTVCCKMHMVGKMF